MGRLIEMVAHLLGGLALGACLVTGCTATQRQQAHTVLEVLEAGCVVAELAEDNAVLRRVCLAPAAAAQLLEHLDGAAGAGGASGAAGQAGAAGVGGSR